MHFFHFLALRYIFFFFHQFSAALLVYQWPMYEKHAGNLLLPCLSQSENLSANVRRCAHVRTASRDAGTTYFKINRIYIYSFRHNYSRDASAQLAMPLVSDAATQRDTTQRGGRGGAAERQTRRAGQVKTGKERRKSSRHIFAQRKNRRGGYHVTLNTRT